MYVDDMNKYILQKQRLLSPASFLYYFN